MARLFNGTSDFAQLAKIGGLNFERTNTFSVHAYIRQQSVAAQEIYITNIDTSLGNRGWTFGTGGASNNQLLLQLNNNGPGGNRIAVISASATITDTNTWQSVGATYSGSSLASGIKLYVSNSAVSMTTVADALSATMVSSVIPTIGKYSGGFFFKGSIADLAVWNVVLTDGEMAGLASGARPHTVRPASLVLFLPLDGIQSPEPDFSGNANNATPTGTAASGGPPVSLFTRMRSYAAYPVAFRRTLSLLGTRIASRQGHSWQ